MKYLILAIMALSFTGCGFVGRTPQQVQAGIPYAKLVNAHAGHAETPIGPLDWEVRQYKDNFMEFNHTTRKFQDVSVTYIATFKGGKCSEFTWWDLVSSAP